jgi:hypothetical protein
METASIVCRRPVKPNTLINLTRNGRRPLPSGVRFAHFTPPVTGHLPLQAGY